MTLRCNYCGTLVRPKLTKLAKKAASWGLTAFVAATNPQQLADTKSRMMMSSYHDKESYLYCGGCQRDVKVGELFG